MDNEKNISAEDFNGRVSEWGEKVKRRSLGTLVAETSVYSGSLRKRLASAVRKGRDDGVAQSVAFKFLRYGVFVAYGVGNGYIRQGGAVVRGSRSPGRNVKAGPVRRRPVDWLDNNIEKNLNDLTDIAGDYYGDAAAQHVLDELDRITIVKTK